MKVLYTHNQGFWCTVKQFCSFSCLFNISSTSAIFYYSQLVQTTKFCSFKVEQTQITTPKTPPPPFFFLFFFFFFTLSRKLQSTPFIGSLSNDITINNTCCHGFRFYPMRNCSNENTSHRRVFLSPLTWPSL